VEGKLELLCPPILFFEVLNALKYSKLFDKSELDSAGESLEKYGFKVITIQKKIRKTMVKIAVDCDMSIYDASYVALSIAKGCVLCTADSKIAKKLPNKLKNHIKNLSEFELS